MSDLIGDLSSMLGISGTGNLADKSTSRANNTELNMDDFLQLMIVQLTNQTIDDTMDTSEMMNQFLQMQMITAMSNMTDVSIQSYANSLVGKLVTVGILNGNSLEERELYVMGTGTFNGEQVIFCSDGNMYYLSQIMAVGMLPNADGTYGDSTSSGTTTEEEHYGFDLNDDGEEETVYVGADGKPGTEDDWYYADVDGDGKDEKIYAGADGIPGTADDWYYSVNEDGEEEKMFIGPDRIPGTEDDGTEDIYPEYKGEQGTPTE